jgi:hypothetical protein
VSYAFDRLGFLQFEQLCAAVFELEGGIPSSAWAGEADRCRAVFSGSPLVAPVVSLPAPAPVLVQCAWIRSRTAQELLDAIARMAERRAADLTLAASFVLVTNADVDDEVALTVSEQLGHRLEMRVLGPRRLAERLDARSELRRAMPSVLGLRDLDGLIHPEVAARSSLDRAAAVELAHVFVPTNAYRRALAVLDAHRFAVLTGPPEMGKTAIARMVALAQMTAGWEAHECIRPEDVWRVFDPQRSQVFVADDAFGSTEYRPDAAERWAREMERILRSLDELHWLIWTSRPAPLRAGLRRLHRERGAERFPAPGEVLVDASRLEPDEKTLILFRHAKAADLPGSLRTLVRRLGAKVVAHRHFTPERIRRFVAGLREAPVVDLAELVERELGDPTGAMRSSFAALDREHRDLLTAMLDTPPGPVTQRELVHALRRHHDGALPRPPAELVDRLTDHFLRVENMKVEWVHPSWRDLVIEQLGADDRARENFLHRCSIHGTLLALSTAGGPTGGRRFPLLARDADWDALTDHLHGVVTRLDQAEMVALLDTLEASARGSANIELDALARAFLARVAHEWDSRREPIALPALEAWMALRSALPAKIPTPAIAVTWAELLPTGPPDLTAGASVERFADWLTLATVLRDYEPRLLAELNFPGRSRQHIDRLVDGLDLASRDVLDDAVLEHAVRALARTASLIPELAERVDGVRYSLARSRIWEDPPPLSSPVDREPIEGSGYLDIERVLRDL